MSGVQLEGKRGNRLLLRHISWPHRVGQCFAVTFWPLTWFVGCHFPIQSLLTFVWHQSTTFPNFQRGTATYLLVTLDWLLTLPSGRHVNATFNLPFQVRKASLVPHLPPSLISSFLESWSFLSFLLGSPSGHYHCTGSSYFLLKKSLVHFYRIPLWLACSFIGP